MKNRDNKPNWAGHGSRLWQQRIGWLVVLLGLAGLAVLIVSGVVGWQLTHPPRVAVDQTPAALGLSYEPVSFFSRDDGVELEGWLLPAATNRRTVILAHGYRRNRLHSDIQLLDLARVLVANGNNVLMFDFRNCGESGGGLTSVGQFEVNDLLGAVDFIRDRPELNRKVVVQGFSMGAATAILAGSREPAVAAVVADSAFADLKPYLESNLSLWTGLPAVPFNRAFLLVTPLLTGLQPDQVSPVAEIPGLNGRKVLLIHGEADIDIPPSNSEQLQAACPGAELLRFPGAGHVRSLLIDRERYHRELLRFLNTV